MAPTAMYVHIPFCKQICYYCDFNKFYIDNQPVTEYVQALKQEMTYAFQDKVLPLSSIYIGGGTPTALSIEDLETVLTDIHENTRLDKGGEFTVEVNPGEADADKLLMMKKLGVNRLSIGVQAFQNSLLSKIGRTHSAEEAQETIALAKKAGFENISIDLMFGLPGQTMEMWEETIQTMLALDIPHVSAYSLKIEEKTMFYNWYRQGALEPMPEDEEAQMYEKLTSLLFDAGYDAYEISNFAKKGYESQHNQVYWKNEEYFGFGAGAHGYLDGERYMNTAPLNHYIKAVQHEKTAVKERHSVSLKEKMEEEMFMGLRMKKGVDDKRFKEKYGCSYLEVFENAVPALIKQGLLINTEGSLRLTEKGRLLGNEVFEQFLLD
ncbi:coproporphyrinogen III oxidase, anaerobic [Alteribacillus persepolensis]|uniref:Heme chaperone HemW n=1 Tax=Alteribacillus persepolensis TaxID=568899 RepID=A0A1G8CPJ7_9BACI|nr:radical SAM family heme chaperone HemW [Alteribacillus persepolensis]SDH47223.1 coproporphyrinogen III oxidase, anaerobic [Alteribacillus persepolensis]